MNGSPAVDLIAAEALTRQPERSLPLAPSGRLRQHVLDRVTVSADGQTQALQLVAHTGLGFEPNYLWLTDAPQPRFFAVVAPGYYSLVQAPWQAVLGQRQKLAQATLERQRAAEWPKPLPGLTVVRNARVFDSLAARLGPASDVYILRSRIMAVMPAGAVPPQAPDTTIDAAGRVMLPGLFDMHDHAWRGNGGLHLAAGVTSTRDMANDNAELQRLIDDAAAGQLAYPQVVPAGIIEGESAFSYRQAFVIQTLDQARAAVDWYAQRGYPQIKIYNSFPKEHLRETVAYAHARGLRVSGHVPAFLRADDVLDAGFDEIQHVNQLLLNFWVTPQTDTRTLERFTLPAQRLGELDLDSAPVQAFIARLARQATVVDLIGMTPAQALQVATVNGARYTRTLDDRGSITPGKRADLVLVDGEPTKNIDDIRRVALVITQGKWLAPREVHEAIGVAPFVATTPTVTPSR